MPGNFDGLQRQNSKDRFLGEAVAFLRNASHGPNVIPTRTQIQSSIVRDEINDYLRIAAGVIESTQVPHATLTNNIDTTITGMTDIQQSWGLEVDPSGSYIEIKGAANQSLFLLSFTVDFAANNTGGDREIRWQFYDNVAGTWGNTYYTRRLRRGIDPSSAKETYTDTWIYNHIKPELSRVRIQIKQTSGGNRAIDIPILRVMRIL